MNPLVFNMLVRQFSPASSNIGWNLKRVTIPKRFFRDMPPKQGGRGWYVANVSLLQAAYLIHFFGIKIKVVQIYVLLDMLQVG